MNWGTELPTDSGYYWWREPGSLEACIVEVDIQTQTVSSPGTDDPASLDETDGGEWYGPLKQPE